jgi:hypothetical protein
LHCVLPDFAVQTEIRSGLGREIQTLRIHVCLVYRAADHRYALGNERGQLPAPAENRQRRNQCGGRLGVSWGCFYWYRFVAERSGRYSRIGKTEKVLLALPTMAITALLIASVFTGWLFFIDGEDHFGIRRWCTCGWA